MILGSFASSTRDDEQSPEYSRVLFWVPKADPQCKLSEQKASCSDELQVAPDVIHATRSSEHYELPGKSAVETLSGCFNSLAVVHCVECEAIVMA